jgi:cell division protein FtsL
MANELPTLKSTDRELEVIYDVHSKRFFHWLETNGTSANGSRDIALLAHNELVKRSNNRFSKFSKILTIAVFILSLITVVFAVSDYTGDKEWQRKQIRELELINKNLTKKNAVIESLKLELDKANEKILSLEKGNKTIKK